MNVACSVRLEGLGDKCPRAEICANLEIRSNRDGWMGLADMERRLHPEFQVLWCLQMGRSKGEMYLPFISLMCKEFT
jgi:hypothetical protein